MRIGMRLSTRPKPPPDPIGAATFGFLAGIVATVALILTLRSNNSQSKALAVSTPELEAAAAAPAIAPALPDVTTHAATVQQPLDPDLEAAKWRIKVGVLEYIEQNAGLWIGKPETRVRPDGKVDIVVPISWNIDPEPALAVLNEHFRAIGTRPVRHGLVSYRSAPGTKKRYATQLFDWLTRQRLTVRVRLGSDIQTLTLAAGRSCAAGQCRTWGKDRYQIQFAHEAGDAALIASEPGGEREPLVFQGMPADVLETHGVDATVMIEGGR